MAKGNKTPKDDKASMKPKKPKPTVVANSLSGLSKIK